MCDILIPPPTTSLEKQPQSLLPKSSAEKPNVLTKQPETIPSLPLNKRVIAEHCKTEKSPAVTITIGDVTMVLPVNLTSQGKPYIDTTKFYIDTGVTLLDKGLRSTAANTSNISYVDGENCKLYYRGYDIKWLVENKKPLGVIELVAGEKIDINHFRTSFNKSINKILPNLTYLTQRSPDYHPTCQIFDHFNLLAKTNTQDNKDPKVLLSKTMGKILYSFAAPFIQYTATRGNERPLTDDPCYNLYLTITQEESPSPDSKTFDLFKTIFILLMTHGQNASSATVHRVACAGSSLLSSIRSGLDALIGNRHGGASEQAYTQVVEKIIKNYNGSAAAYLKAIKEGNEDKIIPGMGHRVYRGTDPRVKILKELLEPLRKDYSELDRALTILQELEALTLDDPYYTTRGLYPNVDLYFSTICQTVFKLPPQFNSSLFGASRCIGWFATWIEAQDCPIDRPRGVYTGEVGLEELSDLATMVKA